MSNDSLSSLPRQYSTALAVPPPIPALLADDLMAPYRHVCSLESKKFRGALVDAFNVWLCLPSVASDEVKAIVDMLHNASLIVDDIEDSSNLRRGAPAAHRVFGMPLALNSANTMYFVALERIRTAPHNIAKLLDECSSEMPHAAALSLYYRSHATEISLKLCEAFTTEMIQLHHGQGLDIYWRDMAQCPSLSEYDEMVLKKTGGLFRLAVKLMNTLSPPKNLIVVRTRDGDDHSTTPVEIVPSQCDDDAGHQSAEKSLLPRAEPHAAAWRTMLPKALQHDLLSLVDVIGIFFQTLDDYLNVCSDVYHKNKSFCEDLTEGKFSYPIIHCVHSQAANGEKTLLHMLRQRPTDVDVKRYCVQLMHGTGSLQACQARIEELRRTILDHVDRLGDGDLLRRCVEGLCQLM